MRKLFRRIRGLVDDPAEAATVLAIMAIMIAAVGYVVLHVLKRNSVIITDFYANVATEMLSIAVTVLIIDRLYQRRSKREEVRRVCRQMASPDEQFAREAVRLAIEEQWFSDGSMVGADLGGVLLQDAYLWEANLEGAKLRKANLKGAELAGANLQGVDLEGANLKGANLQSANLQGSVCGANLKGADLRNAYLKGTDLRGANLEGADLQGANLEGAIYNSRTIWPDGVTPIERGAIKLDFATPTIPLMPATTTQTRAPVLRLNPSDRSQYIDRKRDSVVRSKQRYSSDRPPKKARHHDGAL